MDLTEAEDIKKRWQEYTEELYKKDLHDPDNHNGVITHLEPDILKCEVKWASGSITMNKASRGDRISVELFQTLNDDAVKAGKKKKNQGGRVVVKSSDKTWSTGRGNGNPLQSSSLEKPMDQFSSVQSLTCVRLFVTP